MYITAYRRTDLIDFGEYRINNFFTGEHKKPLHILSYGENFFKVFHYPNGAFETSVKIVHIA